MTPSTSPHGLGRRKTARAQVLLLPDATSRQVNGQPFTEYFPTVSMQEAALAALKTTSQIDTFGFKAKVSGGGKHSQAGAMKLAIARALLSADAGFRKQLRTAGLLTRDSRMKERKKPGLKRARKAAQWKKR